MIDSVKIVCDNAANHGAKHARKVITAYERLPETRLGRRDQWVEDDRNITASIIDERNVVQISATPEGVAHVLNTVAPHAGKHRARNRLECPKCESPVVLSHGRLTEMLEHVWEAGKRELPLRYLEIVATGTRRNR